MSAAVDFALSFCRCNHHGARVGTARVGQAFLLAKFHEQSQKQRTRVSAPPRIYFFIPRIYFTKLVICSGLNPVKAGILFLPFEIT